MVGPLGCWGASVWVRSRRAPPGVSEGHRDAAGSAQGLAMWGQASPLRAEPPSPPGTRGAGTCVSEEESLQLSWKAAQAPEWGDTGGQEGVSSSPRDSVPSVP